MTDNDITLGAGTVEYRDNSSESFNQKTFTDLTHGATYWVYKNVGNVNLYASTNTSDARGNTKVCVGVIRVPNDATGFIRFKAFTAEGKDIIIAEQVITKDLAALNAILGKVSAAEIETNSYLHLNAGADIHMHSHDSDYSAIVFGTGAVGVDWTPYSEIFSRATNPGMYFLPITDGTGYLEIGTASTSPERKWNTIRIWSTAHSYLRSGDAYLDVAPSGFSFTFGTVLPTTYLSLTQSALTLSFVDFLPAGAALDIGRR